jgi:glycosyltransferase involved in cell wall biosynthesis
MADGLHLALDVGPVRSQPAGVGSYAVNLALGLAARMGDSLALIGVRQESRSLDAITGVPRQPLGGRNYNVWLQLQADRQAHLARARLVHYTNAGAPLATRLPYVLTVHDLSLIRYPGTHPVARLATLPVVLWSIARARVVVVPSAWTARELRRIGVDGRRMAIIPHAPVPAPDSTDVGESLAALGVSDSRFILAVGTVEPRKNLVRLIAAFERLADRHPDLHLVIAGAPGWHCAPIFARIESSPVRSRIVAAGYVSAETLAALTRASAAVAYVSIYEGFGMPVLDAMSLGAAVVTSDRSAMPEAAGGAAVLVDPFDSAAIARGLERALDERDALGEAGRERAARRSWSDVAAEHVEVYRWATKGS